MHQHFQSLLLIQFITHEETQPFFPSTIDPHVGHNGDRLYNLYWIQPLDGNTHNLENSFKRHNYGTLFIDQLSKGTYNLNFLL